MRNIFKTMGENKINLNKCGYLNKEYENQFVEVDILNRSDLLNYRKNNRKYNCVPFVLNYSRGLSTIHPI